MREYFLSRIFGEYQAYKASVLGCTNSEKFGKSFEIDSIVNIYVILTEKADKIPDDTLAVLLEQRNILGSLYDLWLKKEDSLYKELEEHVTNEIKNLAA